MKLATEIIKDRYYVKLNWDHKDELKPFQFRKEITTALLWDSEILTHTGEIGNLHGLQMALKENRLFELTEDEFIIRSIE